MSSTGLTQRVATFIAEFPAENFPPEARRLAVRAILDTVGVTVAGSRDESGQIALAYARELGGDPSSAVIASGWRTSPPLAAMVNGVMAHALDFDDSTWPAYSHPSCHLVPALLALAEARGASGRAVVSSYLVGFEVEVRLHRMLRFRHGSLWHPTAMLGTMSATAACARLLGLDVQRTTMALGIATSSTAGTYQNIGTMTKPFHAGRGAMSGVMAACLAEKGFTGAPDILEGQNGFLRLYASAEGEPFWDQFEKELGQRFEITLPYGLIAKPHPSCGATHPSIQAALELRRQYSIDPADIVQIDIGVSKMLGNILIYDRPVTGTQARFSLPFTVAAAFLYGRVGPAEFSDEIVQRPEVVAMRSRVRYAVHAEMAESKEFAAVMRVTLRDGRTLENRVQTARGKNLNPFTDDELLEKFYGCVEPTLSRNTAAKLAQLLHGIEELATVESIAELLMRREGPV